MMNDERKKRTTFHSSFIIHRSSFQHEDPTEKGTTMTSLLRAAVAASIALSALPPIASAGDPPVVPVGADAYLQWERWPYQRLGTRAYLRSTYDRSGGNESADASHFLYQ